MWLLRWMGRKNGFRKLTAETGASLNLRFPGPVGAALSLSAVPHAAGTPFSESLHLVGSLGELRLTNGRLSTRFFSSVRPLSPSSVALASTARLCQGVEKVEAEGWEAGAASPPVLALETPGDVPKPFSDGFRLLLGRLRVRS